MDPTNPASFNHRYETLSTGRRYHFVDQLPSNYNPTTTKTLLCVHGFPDLWYGWRFQIKPWVEAGYRVVAPDMLGYGGTDQPESETEYTGGKIGADLAALLDLLGVAKAVIIGHDWGSFTVGRFAIMYPERLLALVMMSVPYSPPRKEYQTLESLVDAFPGWSYQLYLREKSTNHEVAANAERFLRVLYLDVVNAPSSIKGFVFDWGKLRRIVLGEDVSSVKVLLSDQELKYYTEQYRDWNGPLNYYRTTAHRFEEEKDLSDTLAPRSDLPYMLLIGDKDISCSPAMLHLTKATVPQAEIHVLEGAGHWLMVERTQFVTDTIAQFLHKALESDPAKL